MTILKVERLYKTYSGVGGCLEILKDLTFEVERGAMVAIMGASGSGKTTLLHLLGALDVPDRGKIEVGGQDITRYTAREKVLYRRREVGYIFQQFNLVSSLTALENIELPLLYAGVPYRRAREQAERSLESVGLMDRADHRPALLSGGEQQRVAIARALVHGPHLLLADEPTGNLDSRNARLVLDLLKRVQGQLGQTILLVTHDPWVAEQADCIFYLRDGVLEKGG
ncbi:MAG: ABC transporter ATP-binding protein [Planctomycetota bacterium]|nr:MAG: ABC transporter ATP-binding protein [Planctomycetota bacterium]